MNLDLHSAVVDKIEFYRHKYKLSKLEFAKLSGISASFYYNVINRKNSPSIDFIIRAADCFNIAVCDFLNFIPLKSKPGFTTYNVLIDADQKFENPYEVIKSIGIQDYSTCARAVDEDKINELIQTYRESIASRLRKYLQATNTSSKSFADVTGISESYLCNVLAASYSITTKILQSLFDSPISCNIAFLFEAKELDESYYTNKKRIFLQVPANWDSFISLHTNVFF